MTATEKLVEQIGGFPQVQSAMSEGRTPPPPPPVESLPNYGTTRKSFNWKSLIPGNSATSPDDVPGGFPIGQQPTAPCAHDYLFLRTDRPGKTAYERAGATDVDTFYCRHCLAYRTVERNA